MGRERRGRVVGWRERELGSMVALFGKGRLSFIVIGNEEGNGDEA